MLDFRCIIEISKEHHLFAYVAASRLATENIMHANNVKQHVKWYDTLLGHHSVERI